MKSISKNNTNSENRKYDWLQFAESYIDLSLLSCESLLSNKGCKVDCFVKTEILGG